ncbi:MAG: MFS transporter, partial [Anaerolineae bacterium]|nr:MFS transporter [Anaerolineae bacterium]
MLTKLKTIFLKYPKQFWLLFSGMFIAMLTGTMIWPLLLIYVSKRLSMPLTQIASLMTINAVVGVAFTFVAGPLADKIGRKWIMVVGLIVNASGYLFMMWADSYAYFAILMVVTGFSNPLFRVGADAMLTDIIPEKQRLDAFALTRMAKNVGVSMGPAIGGILAGISYNISFITAASGMAFFSIIVIFFVKETLPRKAKGAPTIIISSEPQGYREMFKDKEFVSMISLYTLGWILVALIWILLPVYANQQYGIPENQYGLIPAANGLMVIFFQVLVTKRTKHFSPLSMITLGMFLYTLGTGSVAFSTGFFGFLLSIIIVTIGELIIVPTSSAYVANRAHPEMRGRYMGIYNFSWSFARGVGPLLGGFLSDSFGPVSIWYGGFIIGTLSSFGLLLL